jgi:DNA-binding transcriptional ArsR family regulator
VALELGERVGGESVRAELSLERVDEVVAERTKIRDMNASPENREQGASVGEEEAFLPLDPYEVQVPVVVSRRKLAEGDVDGPCSVTALAESVGMEQSAVSHQLRILRHLRLVIGERSGRNVLYALHDSHVGVLLEEATNHVAHLRLDYPERAKRLTA